MEEGDTNVNQQQHTARGMRKPVLLRAKKDYEQVPRRETERERAEGESDGRGGSESEPPPPHCMGDEQAIPLGSRTRTSEVMVSYKSKMSKKLEIAWFCDHLKSEEVENVGIPQASPNRAM